METLKNFNGNNDLILTLLESQDVFVIKNCMINKTTKTITIELKLNSLSFYCPRCGLYNKNEQAKFNSTYLRTAKHLPLFEYQCILIFPVYQVRCEGCRHLFTIDYNFIDELKQSTKKFNSLVYELRKVMTGKDVAAFLKISEWKVKEIDKEFITKEESKRELKEVRVLSIDEKAYKSGKKDYFHIISDIEHEEIIGVGEGRGEEEVAKTLKELANKPNCLNNVRYFFMDMWKGFINCVENYFIGIRIIFDKFHIMRNLNKALNEVRKSEYKKAKGLNKEVIKGKKFLLLSRQENLKKEGRKNLKELLKLNKRISKAYILKETFAQIFDYKLINYMRRYFNQWKEQLKWSRLKPLQKFVKMIDKHFYGIENYANLKKDVGDIPLGYLEEINNKIELLKRMAYGYRDKDYFKLKIIQMCSRSLSKFTPWKVYDTS